MKKLTLIALALIATISIASAQNTPVKKEVKTEKSCCSEKKAGAVDKKDAKKCNHEVVKDANGKVVKCKDCADKKAGVACTDKKAAKSCCDKKEAKKEVKKEACDGNCDAKTCTGDAKEQPVKKEVKK